MVGCIAVSDIATFSGVSNSNLSNIPVNSTEIFIDTKNVSVNVLYNEVIDILLSKSHRILKDDKVRHYLITEGKDVGGSTLQRMVIVFTEKENGAQAKITTEWKGGYQASIMATAMSGIQVQGTWQTAKWSVDRLGIAFAESVSIALAIENGIITYK